MEIIGFLAIYLVSLVLVYDRGVKWGILVTHTAMVSNLTSKGVPEEQALQLVRNLVNPKTRIVIQKDGEQDANSI